MKNPNIFQQLFLQDKDLDDELFKMNRKVKQAQTDQDKNEVKLQKMASSEGVHKFLAQIKELQKSLGPIKEQIAAETKILQGQ